MKHRFAMMPPVGRGSWPPLAQRIKQFWTVKMTVAVMKTKAELALAEQFQGAIATLPGGPEVARTRRAAIAAFGELGLPHRRIEDWKYTDLRSALKEPAAPSVDDTARLTVADVIVALGPYMDLDAPRIVFVNGHYRRALSDPAGCEKIRVMPLSEHFDTLSTAISDAVAALNTAFVTDGAVVDIPAGAKLEKPLLLVHLAAGREARASTLRHTITIGADATATIVELYLTLPGSSLDPQANALTEITIGDRANITHVKAATPGEAGLRPNPGEAGLRPNPGEAGLRPNPGEAGLRPNPGEAGLRPNPGEAGHRPEGGRAIHLANWVVKLGADTQYRGFQQTSGLALARNQIAVTFCGEGASLDLSGAFLGRGADHIDTTMVIDHAVPRCTSRELFTGVLDGRARGIFQGKVIVRPDAQKTDGKQMARVMMLSPDAEFDSKPELEIYADDVVCGHGSTVAEIDEDLLFYCRARGIPLDEARALLVQSFIGEAIAKVEHEGVRECLTQTANEWLAAGHPGVVG